MTDPPTSGDAHQLREAIRQACVEAALAGYEDASLRGLCREGAWEAAVSAIRRVDVGGLALAPFAGDATAADVNVHEALSQLTARLSREFASAGPPAAGSAAAVTGAMAAGLLEWAATLSKRRGPESFRPRAHTIARRATVLQSSLASAAERDAEMVRNLLDAQASRTPSETRRRATDSLLEIAARCTQAATLSAEIATQGYAAIRSDVEAALRLACSATECALNLTEENLRDEVDEEWARDARRRAWRARLLLQRAASLLQDKESPEPG